MEIPDDYKILYLYKIKQYDECLKLCEEVLKDKNDRMIEFIRMRAMTIQVKVAANAYDEVDYFTYQDELTSTAVAKTPRPGTTFDRQIRTAHQTSTNVSAIISCRFRSAVMYSIMFVLINVIFNLEKGEHCCHYETRRQCGDGASSKREDGVAVGGACLASRHCPCWRPISQYAYIPQVHI